MKFRDQLEIAFGALVRQKLRTLLTLSGVVIAIAAFVSMLSFGAGIQANVQKEYDDLGLFHTMQVYPPRTDTAMADTAVLDEDAMAEFLRIPGVNLAYPFDNYDIEVQVKDTSFKTSAQALPMSAIQTQLYSDLLAGGVFSSDSAKEAVVTDRFFEKFKDIVPDSLVGETLVVSVDVVSMDSALAHLIYHGNPDSIKSVFRSIELDSVWNPDYRSRLLNREAGGAIRRFLDGMFNARARISDTLIITGVMHRERGRARIQPVIFPIRTAQLLNSRGFAGDQIGLVTALASGQISLFNDQQQPEKTFNQVTLDLDPMVLHKNISDSIKALGFRTFSYAEQFEEIQRAFVFMNMALGMVGLIALITASLGIVNTMVMSILERRREIGIVKSLGADESDIRFMFLVESGLIGLLGASGGLLLGWLISRIASFVAKKIMENEGAPIVELFSVPIWLIFAALALGILVSLAAGAIPSARAARVDPVAALRNE